ncbi:MAG: hypothetical protein ACYSUB_22905 [Planctomycetota bacterium]
MAGKPKIQSNGHIVRVSYDKANDVYWLYQDGKRLRSNEPTA